MMVPQQALEVVAAHESARQGRSFLSFFEQGVDRRREWDSATRSTQQGAVW